jgi:hypothetical protein
MAADAMRVQLNEPIRVLVRLGVVGMAGLEPAASSL